MDLQFRLMLFKGQMRDFPGGPMVKNPPCSAGESGLMLGQGTKIPQDEQQLSPNTAKQINKIIF